MVFSYTAPGDVCKASTAAAARRVSRRQYKGHLPPPRLRTLERVSIIIIINTSYFLQLSQRASKSKRAFSGKNNEKHAAPRQRALRAPYALVSRGSRPLCPLPARRSIAAAPGARHAPPI